MKVIALRPADERRYVRLYSADMARTDLSPLAKILLALLQLYTHDSGHAHVNAKRLARAIGAREGDIEDSLGELAEAGLLAVPEE